MANTNLTDIIRETLKKVQGKKAGKEKLTETIKALVKEVYAEDKKALKEGFLTSSWEKIKAKLDKAPDWNSKKTALEKEINNSNTKTKGAWLNKLKAANDESAVEAIITDIDKRPGKDLEDKLAGKSAAGAASSAIFRENKNLKK